VICVVLSTFNVRPLILRAIARQIRFGVAATTLLVIDALAVLSFVVWTLDK
jgi:hypothetical protein